MQNKEFIELRKSKKMSQATLAKKMYKPIPTIRNWERKDSIPSIDEMSELAKILEVTEETILSIFKPEKTRVEKEKEKEGEIYNLLLESFWGCNIIEVFLKFTSIFSLRDISGVFCCQDYVFPFTKIIADTDGSTAIFTDTESNCIVLTTRNILEVEPVSIYYDVYTFDINVNCPMFPTDLEYSTNSFKQKLRLSIFNR